MISLTIVRGETCRKTLFPIPLCLAVGCAGLRFVEKEKRANDATHFLAAN